MHPPAFPPDEEHRIAALRSLGLLDTEPEADFDAVVCLGRSLFDVPMCLISLVDSSRQWFKSCAGLAATETPRDISFCGHAILRREALVVLDATRDPRFHDNPLVAGPPNIRFYAGVPIWLPSGYPIGTLCVLSPVARTEFSAGEVNKLTALAGIALNAIAVRALRQEMDSARADADRYRMAFLSMPQPVAVASADGMIEDCNEAFADLAGADRLDGGEAGDDPANPWSATLWPPATIDQPFPEHADIRFPDAGIRVRVHRHMGGYVLIGGPGG